MRPLKGMPDELLILYTICAGMWVLFLLFLIIHNHW